MQEIIGQITAYIRGTWRYRWYALSLSWVIIIVGWLVVFRIPAIYESSARVYVDTESILRPLLSGLAIRPNISERLALINRTLLSRPNLEKVIRIADLDLKIKTQQEKERALEKLASNIRFTSARRHNLYTITYRDNSPEIAKSVVQALVTILVESTLGETRKDSDSAQDFLMKEIAKYEKRLKDAENRIKNFKKKNVGMMPSEEQGYFKRLQLAKGELAKAHLQLNESRNRRDELERQLAGEEPSFGFDDPLFASPSSPSRRLIRHPLDARIENLQDKLDELLLQYTARHPSVISIQNTIDALKKQRQEDLKGIPTVTTKVKENTLEMNPVYQQLKIDLGQAKADIASLTVREKEYRKRVTELEKLVDTLPEVEGKLKSMNRDYTVTKKNYEALVGRLESAKLSEQAGQTGEDVKIKIIDPPRLPITPSGTSQLILSSGVFFGGIAGGILLALFLFQLRPVVFDRRTLGKICGVPVFGAVSMLMTPAAVRKKFIVSCAFASVSITLIFMYGGVLYLQSRGVDLTNQNEVLQFMSKML